MRKLLRKVAVEKNDPVFGGIIDTETETEMVERMTRSQQHRQKGAELQAREI